MKRIIATGKKTILTPVAIVNGVQYWVRASNNEDVFTDYEVR